MNPTRDLWNTGSGPNETPNKKGEITVTALSRRTFQNFKFELFIL